jgi:dTDP-4-amino-4,6-dideoxy-D-galactose acyltransferase
LDLEKLEWDSNFFGLPVYCVSIEKEEDVKSLVALSGRHNSSLVFIVQKNIEKNVRECLESVGAICYGTRVTYEKRIGKVNYFQSELGIMEYEGEVTEDLVRLSVNSGGYSRFKKDPKLRPYFESLFQKWIVNSLDKSIADKTYVYNKNGRLLSFLTLRIKKSQGWIGLISVEKSVRGKGIGKALLDQAEKYFIAHGAEMSYVVTQEENMTACRFYEACGYHISASELIYHWWI